MPIGVPRIIYCWGEELPPQWTDIYNFIFRRRMVFLMQYLDDELCNQICGLLINIHMEDRSKELEKKEVEKSSIFKKTGSSQTNDSLKNMSSQQGGAPIQNRGTSAQTKKKEKSMKDLLSSYGTSGADYEEDLAIDENTTLEQFTLQKITLEWLNWNAQFFDYSDEPYLFYLAEILSKNSLSEGTFSKDDIQLLYKMNRGSLNKTLSSKTNITSSSLKEDLKSFDVYSPFRSIVNVANLISKDKNFSLNNLLPKSLLNSSQLNQQLKPLANLQQNPQLGKLVAVLASKNCYNTAKSSQQNQLIVPSQALGQRNLRKEYAMDHAFQKQNMNTPFSSSTPFGGDPNKRGGGKKALNYLDFDSANGNQSYLFAEAQTRNEYSRNQTKKALQEEETKKVFVIINSFGGSVGNGITVHDALQFIKAGSLTLGLGVAASAASLVLAGGTISERYVTEGCHVMIHQPSSSINGQASDIWIDSQEIMKIRLDVAEIYSLSAHRPRHKILRDLDRDFYLTATETIHYGLADEIATNEVMHDIIEMTSKVWSYHDSKQQSLLEARDRASSGMETQLQN